jgi:hypothetical protein
MAEKGWPKGCGATGTIRFNPELSHGANAGEAHRATDVDNR